MASRQSRRGPGSTDSAADHAAWTFGGTWDPERTHRPVDRTGQHRRRAGSRFDYRASVTVKGKPRLVLEGGGFAGYESGSGTDTLVFTAPAGKRVDITAVDLNGGTIIATEAAATIRTADLTLR